VVALAAPQIAPHDPYTGDLGDRLIPPVWAEGGRADFLLGTDVQGRDILSRVIFGARVSLWIGFLAATVSMLAGTLLGALAGYYRGWLDAVLSRFAELLLAFPLLIFAIGVMAFLGPGFVNLLLALTFKNWVSFFRLVRGEMLAERAKEYVEAAHAIGRPNPVIIVSEILPNIVHSILVLTTLDMGGLILAEAGLSFLGLGIQPPTPAWGSMVADGRDYMLVAWWIPTIPGIALLLLILSINLFGEGLRDILDPRLKIG
jgi:ABC-type dipeptide/oligopeptide/nickel transport system permease subunit